MSERTGLRTLPLFLMEFSGWRIKVYGIAPEGEEIDPRLVEQACWLARRELRRPGSCDPCQEVGYLVIRQGPEGVRLRLDWWAGSTLHRRDFSAPPDHPLAFRRVRDDESDGSIGERAIVDHERRAWADHVLSHPSAPDVRGYLEDRLETDSAA